jgi:peptidylprolyl isomerase
MDRLLTRISFLTLSLLVSVVVAGQEAAETSGGPPSELASESSQDPSPAAVELAPADGKGAQDASAAEEPPEEVRLEYQRRLEAFQQARKALEMALGDQRESYIRFVNMEDRSDAARDRYYQRRDIVRHRLDDAYTAGLEVLRMGLDQETATFMVTVLQHRFGLDIYDAETLEGAARLIDGGSKLLYLFQVAARSAIVDGRFDMAEQLYKAIENEELEEVDKALKFNLQSLQAIHEAEQPLLEQAASRDDLPRVAIKTTQGDVLVELYLDQAPSTVAHFISLVEQGFYDGLDFHHVINHLVAMTGDPTGLGSGNCGKYLIDEHDRPDARKGLRGSLVMAKLPTGEAGKFVPHSSSSQFAILYLPIVSVTEQQTVFGRVIEGMDAISRLRRVDLAKKKEKQVLLPPDRIIEATVLRRPEQLPEPQYVQLSRQ